MLTISSRYRDAASYGLISPVEDRGQGHSRRLHGGDSSKIKMLPNSLVVRVLGLLKVERSIDNANYQGYMMKRKFVKKFVSLLLIYDLLFSESMVSISEAAVIGPESSKIGIALAAVAWGLTFVGCPGSLVARRVDSVKPESSESS